MAGAVIGGASPIVSRPSEGADQVAGSQQAGDVDRENIAAFHAVLIDGRTHEHGEIDCSTAFPRLSQEFRGHAAGGDSPQRPECRAAGRQQQAADERGDNPPSMRFRRE